MTDVEQQKEPQEKEASQWKWPSPENIVWALFLAVAIPVVFCALADFLFFLFLYLTCGGGGRP